MLNAANYQYDLVLVDMILSTDASKILGTDVICQARRQLHANGCVLVGCTSNKLKHGSAFIAAGAHDVWQKPLSHRVQDILEQLNSIGK